MFENLARILQGIAEYILTFRTFYLQKLIIANKLNK